jgi:lipopolysaccharide export system protein LptA
VYTDETRVAHYSGGVLLKRPELTEQSRELRAFLKDSSEDSSLDKALADGAVKIVSTSPAAGKDGKRGPRTRTGTSEHAEYYADDGKVVLNTGDPKLDDSLRGTMQCEELIWWADNDTLRCNGNQKKPPKSTIRKK